MIVWRDHLMIAPIVLPLIAAAIILVLGGERWRRVNAALAITTTVSLVVIAWALIARAQSVPGASVYPLGAWPAPFGIVLVVDRLAAMMVLLSALLGLGGALFSLVRWHRVGVYFYPLMLFLLMGVNGAFLTGDLFNLFVFFEVLLAASYGLALHGAGAVRAEAALHYIVVNLVASLLFLIGVSLIYGVSGALNMAHLAAHVAARHGDDSGLLTAGVGILLVAFLIKAGSWPLFFWLPRTYAAAPAPAAAMFAILSMVGVYAVLRLLLLLNAAGTGPSSFFGGGVPLTLGLATVSFGSVGILASRKIGQMASYAVLVSSGTVLAALGLADAAVTAAAVYYMVSSTFAIAALFLLGDLIDKPDAPDEGPLVPREVYGEETDLAAEEIGVAFPFTVGTLGVAFICCALVIAGLPPLSGFVGKFALMTTALGSSPNPGCGLLTIHVLDLVDENVWVHTIKTRYEAPLLEIFS